MSIGSAFRNMAHLIKLIKQHCGIYSIKLPITDEQIAKDIIQDDTLLTFSTYYPREYILPVDLNQIRVRNDRENTTSDLSDIYELPNLFPLSEGNQLLYIEKIQPFNDSRYQSVTSAYETIESFQALALAQGIANLSSLMEPAFTFNYLGNRRFKLSNGTYYRNRVIITLGIGYNPALYDIPMGKRIAFADLAELDVRRFFFSNLDYWREIRTALGDFNLRIDKWESAEDKREEMLRTWNEGGHVERTAVMFF